MKTADKNVIYKLGEMNLQTTTYIDADGIERAQFSGSLYGNGKDDLTVNEYLNIKGSDFVCIPFDEALQRIGEVENKKLIDKWTEITEDQWMEMLEVLPPEKWETVNGVNIFRMCEYTTGNITTHYARTKGRYFCANRRTTDNYEDLAKEVLSIN